MKLRVLALFLCLLGENTQAESLRCKGDIVEIGDTKADVVQKCGQPEITDTYCEKTRKQIMHPNGEITSYESCDNIDVWTYNPGYGQFWTNLYFSQGKLRDMKYGDRVK